MVDQRLSTLRSDNVYNVLDNIVFFSGLLQILNGALLLLTFGNVPYSHVHFCAFYRATLCIARS